MAIEWPFVKTEMAPGVKHWLFGQARVGGYGADVAKRPKLPRGQGTTAFRLLLPNELKRRAARAAEQEGVELSTWIRAAIAEKLSKKDGATAKV